MFAFDEWKEFLDISVSRLYRDRNLYKHFRDLKTNSERIRFSSTVRYELVLLSRYWVAHVWRFFLFTFRSFTVNCQLCTNCSQSMFISIV